MVVTQHDIKASNRTSEEAAKMAASEAKLDFTRSSPTELDEMAAIIKRVFNAEVH